MHSGIEYPKMIILSRFLIGMIILTVTVVYNANALKYYVDKSNPAASNSNSGTENEPWLTIKHAADIVSAGDTVIVKSGEYNERIVIKNSGASGAKITFRAQPRRSVTMWGFYTLNCNYLRIEGFTITTDSSLTDWTDRGGVFVRSDYVEVVDNHFYNISSTAINGYWHDPYPQSAYIADNYIYHCQAGIAITGSNWIIERNEVERLFQYGNGDCDYSRFFGDNHIIRNNYFHGTNFNEVGSAHVDCFQTFTNNGEHAYNILFEANVGYDFHQALMASNILNTSTSHFTFRNNVFAHGLAWGLCVHNVSHITVENNTFADIQYHGAGFRDSSVGNIIRNNIFYKIGSSYWASDGGEVVGDHNLIFEASRPSVTSEYNLLDVDPMFVNPGNNDFHLRPGSPAIDKGQTLPEVNFDFDRKHRPYNTRWDIGAYEYWEGSDSNFVGIPFQYQLHQNYPNPFNSSTTINYFVPFDGSARLSIYDVLGREVRTLIDGNVTVGLQSIQWDGKNSTGQVIGSGVYFYHLRNGNGFVSTKKMILLK
jgi:hypothetical protein